MIKLDSALVGPTVGPGSCAGVAQGRLHAHRRGEGSPQIVFVHGAGGSHLVWGKQVQALSKSHRVTAIDLPGHGRALPPVCSSIAESAGLVCTLLAGMADAPAVLVGHSMGGAIALALALDRPELVRGLVLVATGARLRVAPVVLEGLESDPPAAMAMVNEFAFAPSATDRMRSASDRAIRTCGSSVLRSDLRACNEFDVMDRIAEVSLPTLVIAGAEDRLTPLKYARHLADGITGGRLEVIEGAGHMVMLERPDEVTTAIRSFVSAFH